ncbi:hypothetical protein BD324DRAFT_638754 [Kockovaella imperatae]|uniref:Uncharacterized protein n=1 Tax=Kockovaella imperatae TaxID=4999 RepID=A0A1Y1U8K2_9TREE|nr:hypothetical protein BD324DRAFT_638754 [Kockovaella imperatae]ORX33826.1 hypothetical protein BD324DRAFT_638754 [Kockovaella imperatae]
MANPRNIGAVLAAATGLGIGYYMIIPGIKESSQQISGHGPAPGPIEDGRSQAMKDGQIGSGSAMPRGPQREGGANFNNPLHPTVAGTTPESRRTGSADHNPTFRDDPNVHDGTSGGGVGLAEMRERKMKGQGLPSPQGGDTKPQAVNAVANEGEGGGVPKGKKWLGGW